MIKDILVFTLLVLSTTLQGQNGNVGIGTSDPDSKLEVQGDVKIVDGTQGDGKVFTSDADGKASWQNPVLYIKNGFVGALSTVAAVYDPASSGVITYTGCYITLTPGSWLIKSTSWIGASGANVITPSASNDSFAAMFLSLSPTSNVPPTYLSNIKSIIINPLYHGASSFIQFYGSGDIPITVAETTEVYLWSYVSSSAWTSLPSVPDQSIASVTSHNNEAGSFGPYTQLYAIPINYVPE